MTKEVVRPAHATTFHVPIAEAEPPASASLYLNVLRRIPLLTLVRDSAFGRWHSFESLRSRSKLASKLPVRIRQTAYHELVEHAPSVAVEAAATPRTEHAMQTDRKPPHSNASIAVISCAPAFVAAITAAAINLRWFNENLAFFAIGGIGVAIAVSAVLVETHRKG